MLDILDNNDQPMKLCRYSEMPNGAKYTRNGQFILKVACTKASNNTAMFKEYKPSFNEANYFENMNNPKQRKFIEC